MGEGRRMEGGFLKERVAIGRGVVRLGGPVWEKS